MPASLPARRGIAVLAGTVSALAVWAVVDPVLGVDLAVGSGDSVQHVSAPAVVVASIVAGLAGWALLAVLGRITRRPRPIWTTVAVIVLVLSLLGPLGGVGTSAKVGLAALHIVTGVVVIALLRRTAAPRS